MYKNNKMRMFAPLVALALLMGSGISHAGDKENPIIDKALRAYGGDKLRQLKSVQLDDEVSHYFQSQSGHSTQGPFTMHMTSEKIALSIDFANRRKVFKRATTTLVGNHGSNVPTVTHRLFADNQGYSIDHALMQYQSSKKINFDTADTGLLLVDTLVVKQLGANPGSAKWIDTAVIEGVPHDVLVVNRDAAGEYTIFINQNSGYVSRIVRTQNAKPHSYDFLDHQQTQGITWAKQLLVSTPQQPTYHTNSRTLRVDQVLDSQFVLPGGYTPKPAAQFLDVAKMIFKPLGNGVYFIGEDWGYTLFVDAGDSFISIGAWQMNAEQKSWKRALELLREKTGSTKPVAKHIVSHHHFDHMMGLEDVLNEGAKLVIHPAHIAALDQYLPAPIARERLLPISQDGELVAGKVMLIDIPHSHTNHNWVVYLPQQKLLFTEDMFGSSYVRAFHSPSSWPDIDTYQRLAVLTAKVRELGLEVEQYVSSHHARILSQAEIDTALQIKVPAREVVLQRLFGE